MKTIRSRRGTTGNHISGEGQLSEAVYLIIQRRGTTGNLKNSALSVLCHISGEGQLSEPVDRVHTQETRTFKDSDRVLHHQRGEDN